MAPKKLVSIQKNGPEFGIEYQNKLMLADRQLGTLDFARPFLLDVTLIAIGAPGCKDVDGNIIGAIYLYKGGNYDNIDKNWKQIYKFLYPLTGNEDRLPLDGTNIDFGASTTMTSDGKLLVVGAPGERSEAGDRTGAVYIFSITESSHTLMAKLTPIDPVPGREFGRSVAISDDGNILSVCDKKINDLSKVYTFTKSGKDFSSWFFTGKRTTRNELATFYNYKTKILKLGKTLPDRIFYMDSTGGSTPFVFVGKENVNVLAMSQSIDVVFCTKNKIDKELKIHGNLEDPNKTTLTDCFGHCLSGSPPFLHRLAVGAPGKDNSKGCVYVYVYNGKNFSLFNTLVPADAEEGDKFGFSCVSSSELESAPCHIYAVSTARNNVGPIEKTSSWSNAYEVKLVSTNT